MKVVVFVEGLKMKIDPDVIKRLHQDGLKLPGTYFDEARTMYPRYGSSNRKSSYTRQGSTRRLSSPQKTECVRAAGR